MHLLSSTQYTWPDLERLFGTARRMEEPWAHNLDLYYQARGRLIAVVKDEPSTRTRVSFEVAMKRLGGGVVLVDLGTARSSDAKGETPEDTVRTLGEYVECVVLRLAQRGAVQRAAERSAVPVVNAGDGDGEHPTQALGDLYTLEEFYPRRQPLHVVLGGDLRYGRTAHSLLPLLGVRGGCTLYCASPPGLELPPDAPGLDGVKLSRHPDLRAAVCATPRGPDVLYLTRMQAERHAEGVAAPPCVLDEKTLSLLPPRCVILHPLPRREELPVALDADPRTHHWRQVRKGMFVRMALLYHLFTYGTFFPAASG